MRVDFWKRRGASPISVPPPGGATSRIHAIRTLDAPPGLAEEPRTWLGLEVTVAPPGGGWSPADLALVGEDQPADDAGAWGEVYRARVWTDRGWTEASDATLAGAQRVRLLVGLYEGAPAALRLRHGATRLGPVDLGLARAHAAPAAATIWSAGECARCADMGLVDEQGLCKSCRGVEPCANHPDQDAADRCAGCGQRFCAACLVRRRCPACAPAVEKRKAPARGAARAVEVLRSNAPRDPKKALVAAVGALVLVQGGMVAWDWYANSQPPPSTEQVYEARAGLVKTGVGAFKGQKGRLPADAKELGAFVKTISADAPPVVGPDAPRPDAVVYEKAGETYKVYATTAEGKPYEPEAVGRKARPAD